MKILVIDNYDSFTYNLVHIIRELGYANVMDVFRNDKIDLARVGKYDKILLSPGPGIPSEAGIMMDLIGQYGPEKSILGICLGHQGIAEVYGAGLYNMTEVRHGVGSEIKVIDDHNYLFRNVPDRFKVGLYHSWAVDPATVPATLSVDALSSEEVIMGIRHCEYDVQGLQFHPESIITEHGKTIIENWLKHT
jgi:anthranilate synthase component 2